ncbi:hypothetical protein AQUCO_01600151v1 [Aquilegia coerulea]|uniref:C2H2-type domain-containing protein n=1 Tax=Aquilegia coerulea TaxID=218851 RepID=A0A2G5DQD2_AQUCA|nr:hypothetical protein AQUCO_01600151v1 [Aquilegia coerulea]
MLLLLDLHLPFTFIIFTSSYSSPTTTISCSNHSSTCKSFHREIEIEHHILVFLSKFGLKSHNGCLHAKHQVLCKECGNVFLDYIDLNDHVKKHHTKLHLVFHSYMLSGTMSLNDTSIDINMNFGFSFADRYIVTCKALCASAKLVHMDQILFDFCQVSSYRSECVRVGSYFVQLEVTSSN